jgi:hypothetical protein
MARAMIITGWSFFDADYGCQHYARKLLTEHGFPLCSCEMQNYSESDRGNCFGLEFGFNLGFKFEKNEAWSLDSCFAILQRPPTFRFSNEKIIKKDMMRFLG